MSLPAAPALNSAPPPEDGRRGFAVTRGSALWTRDFPTESGFYWYRETPDSKPDIVIFQLRGGPEYYLPYVWRFAPAPTLGGMFYAPIEGQFWGVRIVPPNIASQTRPAEPLKP